MTVRSPRRTLVLGLGALGIVYGDIGTSPLYALREAFAVAESLEVTRGTVLGILSLIFWAMILVVSVKYLIFVMRADNEGEGGIVALTALVLRTRLGGRAKYVLVAIGIFGTALLYGDGMITPAISVLSAVEGLDIAVSGLEPYVVMIAAVILVALFSFQKRGTAALGAVFGPVMLVWFSVIALLGGIEVLREPSVLAAVFPSHAIGFLLDHPGAGFIALGAIVLVVTGSEALYADMGHFGTTPIRVGWFFVVLPALILNYFGQGAMVIADPATIDNPFYRLAPEWGVIPLVFLATAATVIASQALISGAFSLTMQAVQLGYLPRMRVDHTSPSEYGQVYIGTVNWILMVATVGLVFAFQSSSNLAAAYGVAVTSDMVITTLLVYVVMRRLWKWPVTAAVGLTILFLVVDLSFFGANMLKIPSGGWFPLMVATIVFTAMTTWKKGRELTAAAMHRAELPIERFIGSIVTHPQQRVAGTGVYMFPETGATPPALIANLRHYGVLHESVVLVSIEMKRRPRVHNIERATVHDLGEGFHQVALQFGFMENPDVPEALATIVKHGFGIDQRETTFFLGRETILVTDRPGMVKWREQLYVLMQRNATSAASFFGLPPERVVEVGIQIDI